MRRSTLPFQDPLPLQGQKGIAMTKAGNLFAMITTGLMFACSSGSVGSGGMGGGTNVFIGNDGSGAGVITGNGGGVQVGNTGPLGGDQGGTWVVTGDGGTSKPGPGKNGTGGSSGTGSTGSVTCAPGVVGTIVTGCGYPYASGSLPVVG
jgi:hypothetical protein